MADATIIIITITTTASAKYLIHFTVHFGSVHAFGYNSAESGPIWIKSAAI